MSWHDMDLTSEQECSWNWEDSWSKQYPFLEGLKDRSFHTYQSERVFEGMTAHLKSDVTLVRSLEYVNRVVESFKKKPVVESDLSSRALNALRSLHYDEVQLAFLGVFAILYEYGLTASAYLEADDTLRLQLGGPGLTYELYAINQRDERPLEGVGGGWIRTHSIATPLLERGSPTSVNAVPPLSLSHVVAGLTRYLRTEDPNGRFADQVSMQSVVLFVLTSLRDLHPMYWPGLPELRLSCLDQSGESVVEPGPQALYVLSPMGASDW